ncbi:MAG: RsmE family RNA methyltransferase [Candidatus Planktophila sp.]
MRTLFFVDDLPTTVGQVYTFDNEDALHAIRVLRTGPGEIFWLSDGKGSYSTVKALEVAKKSMQCEVIESHFQEPLDIEYTVIQALPKGDRLKECAGLLTEAGADRIVFWSSARSIGKADKTLNKLDVTIREASKQARRFRIPEIVGPLTTAEVIDEIARTDIAVLFHESATAKLSAITPPAVKKALIIIGPEGGITDDELEAFTSNGAIIALMGRPIFRSAHAGMAGLAALQTLLKSW